MTTSLVPTNQGMEPQGMTGGIDPSDFSIPYVTLVQASSDAVKQRTAQAGAFMSSDGEVSDYIEFVPLHIQNVRDFYDKDAQKNVCGSRDRITGYPSDANFFKNYGNLDITEGTPLSCRECPFFDYAPSPKLACNKGYVVTCYDLTTEQPFMYRVRGTAVRPFRDRFIGAVAMGRSVPWARSFTMTSELKSNGPNSWFAPMLKPLEGFDDDKKAEWAEYAAQFGGAVHTEPESHGVDPDDLPFED